MGCGAKVEIYVQRGYGGEMRERKCGSTGQFGDEIRCEKCENKAPWYICPHGNDISEYDCGQCEGES